MKGNESKKRNGKVKSKHIGRKVGNLVAVMLGASIIAVSHFVHNGGCMCERNKSLGL